MCGCVYHPEDIDINANLDPVIDTNVDTERYILQTAFSFQFFYQNLWDVLCGILL